MAIDQDGTACCTSYEAREKLHQGTFAMAGGPDDGQHSRLPER